MAVEDITTKCCTKCGENKPRDAFSKDADKRDGLSTLCKSCRSAANAVWRAENPDKVKKNNADWYEKNADRSRAYSKEYRAAHPEKTKSTVAAWRTKNPGRSKASMANWYASNKERVMASNAVWRSNNKGKVLSYQATYRASKPDAIRLDYSRRRTGVKLTKNIIIKLTKLQRGKCACCGKPLGKDYHIDHIMPLALGGSNTDDNIQLLRKLCNLQKSAKHPVDFMRSRGFLL